MSNNYSIDDILSELDGKKAASSSGEVEDILSEILGTKQSKKEVKENDDDGNVKSNNIIENIDASVKDSPNVNDGNESKIVGDTITFDRKDVVKTRKKDEKEGQKDIVKTDDSKPVVNAPQKEESNVSDATIQMKPLKTDQNVAPTVEETPHVSVNQDVVEFQENRKKKVEKFVIFGEEEETEPEAEPIEESVKTIEDFNDYSEAPAIFKDLSGIKAGLILRLVILAVLLIASFYMEFATSLKLPVPDILCKDVQPLSYLIVSALIFVASMLVSGPAVFGGIASLFKFEADGDSLLAVPVIGIVVQFTFLLLSPNYILSSKNTVFLYSIVVILGMFFNTIGKLSIIKRVRLNFRFVSGGYEKYAITFPESEKLSNFVKEQFDADYAGVAVPKKSDFIGEFLGYSYRADPADKISKILSPLIFVGALILSVVSFVLIKDFQKAACTFAAITVMCSPISIMLSVNVPLTRVVKGIITRGSMISGMAACNEVYDTNSILVKSSDLFPKGSIQLSAIKTFAAGKIDDVILDAASVVVRAESDLSEVFLSVIGGRKDLLREVDSIVYEESMGLSAWVDSKRILIGNRELIHHHGIAVPSKDYEERYLNSGMDMVYLAESGELVAVFLIQYKPGTQIKKSMKALKNTGIGVVVVSTDPNIDSRKISRIFDVNEEMIKTVPANKQGETERFMRPSVRENVGTASISSFSAFAQTIYAAIRLKGIVTLAVSLQAAASILAFAIMAFFTIISGSSSVAIGPILLYQLFWLVTVLIVPLFRKFKI